MLGHVVRLGALLCFLAGLALPSIERPVALTNARVVSNGVITENGTIIIEHGAIVYVGASRPFLRPGAHWVDVRGAYVAARGAPSQSQIERGRPADLIVLTANPLDTQAPAVRAALVGGRMVSYLEP
ncbi:MAG: hypothetical protein AB7P07_15525 [Hyphomonadaceae bacterium]